MISTLIDEVQRSRLYKNKNRAQFNSPSRFFFIIFDHNEPVPMSFDVVPMLGQRVEVDLTFSLWDAEMSVARMEITEISIHLFCDNKL